MCAFGNLTFRIKYRTSLMGQIHLKEFMKIFGLYRKTGTAEEPSASKGAFTRIGVGTSVPQPHGRVSGDHTGLCSPGDTVHRALRGRGWLQDGNV